MRVRRADEWLRQLAQPELQIAVAPHLGVGDTLLMCAGFEERALEALRRAVHTGCRGFRVLCIEYLPTIPENQGAEVASLCAAAQATLELLRFDRERPSGAAERILARVPPTDCLHIDLSGMSRLLIVQLVAAIVRAARSGLTHVLYCTACDYPPTREQVEARLAEPADLVGVTMFVSAGVFGLTIVPELSSVAMQGQPMRVIAFPSWNATQLAAICSEMQASYFTIVHGTPPAPENAWRRDAIRELNRIDSLPSREEFHVSTLDYRETLELLLRVYAEHGQREKLVVSPTGSKMQSLAVGLACGFLRDLQVAYPTPRLFATPVDYTRGVGQLYRLPLERFVAPAELVW
ncbi:hypothetical protein WME98_30620 [Sorangium sp. So ce296]|uniref:hypothetical protein n=1 Tax=Sorangium sp. So ce296 TaxID=3133296 RepID=UPI003F5EA809